MSDQEAINVLEHLGFYHVRRKGSHIILKKKISEGEIGCVAPLHSELASVTLRGIIRQAKVTEEEFMENL
jgi:predicted RNA binding protein YcfA (HicA-like mRNA interferase family)